MPRFDEPAELNPDWNAAAQPASGPVPGIAVVALDYGGTLTDPQAVVLPHLGMRPVTRAAAQAIRAVHARRVGLVLASNTRGTTRQWALAHAGVLDLFQAVLESHRLGVQKPDALFYERVIEAAGCDPDRILFVGNNPVKDVRRPLEHGMGAALVGSADAASSLPKGAHHVPTIGRLPGLVEALCT